MLLKANDFKGFYDLHCDKSFAFDDIQTKCVLSLVGNCLFEEIKENTDNCILKDDAPDHIKNLVNGVTYDKTEKSCCYCLCDCCTCEKKTWVGLKKLVELCVKSKYLRTKRAFRQKLQNKIDGSIKIIEQPLVCDKVDLHNELTFLNNIGDCNCVSLHTFISENEEDYKDFCGKKLKLISII